MRKLAVLLSLLALAGPPAALAAEQVSGAVQSPAAHVVRAKKPKHRTKTHVLAKKHVSKHKTKK